jgi:hypothetical protein
MADFVDIGGIVDHHCLEGSVVVCFVDIVGTVDHHCLEVIVCLADIGGTVSTKQTTTCSSKQRWSTIPPISTKRTITSEQ